MKNLIKFRGFTLLELLVVIGIIGIMMALATVAYSQTQQSGRNSRRKQDLISIQNALEQYYSANSFSYPTGACSVASTYLKSAWPVDPSSTATTTIPYSESCPSTSSYCICAGMEPATSTSGNSTTSSCGWANGGAYYCVGNLQ